jgi:regulator of sigma E protease
MILNIIIFIAILALLVLVHEFGHFLSAKKFKMYVEEFGFGFPPKIKGWKKGEMTWSINALPLGGFVKIAGEDGEIGPNDYIVEEKVIVQEESVEIIESGTKEIIIEEKITEIDKAAEIPRERFFSSKPIWQRVVVLISGVAMNFILGWLILIIVFTFGTKPVVVVSQVFNNSPAYLAEIKEGDKIVGYSSTESFISYVNNHKGQQILLNVQNGQKTRQVEITPRINVPEGEGPLGVGLSAGGVEKEPFSRAVWDGTKASWQIFTMIYTTLFKLIVGFFYGPNLFQYISGPVGIFEATSQAAGLGIGYLANLIAFISLNLAAINIFPFPALDGGRIIFLIIEKIKGSPVSARIQQVVNGVGFALLITLILAVSIQDIRKLF